MLGDSMHLRIISLSEDDYYAHLDKPHNPPDSSVAASAFDEEYYGLFQRVAAIMSEHGDNDPYDQGDYTLEPHIAESRGLGLSITNAAIVTELLLRKLQCVVSQFAPDWEIYLGSSQYDFGIFIGPTSIRMHRNNIELLPQIDELVASVA
jgi:hypothetical protein